MSFVDQAVDDIAIPPRSAYLVAPQRLATPSVHAAAAAAMAIPMEICFTAVQFMARAADRRWRALVF